MKKYIFPIVISVLLLSSCSEYQKILKSTDPELKYNKAVDYFTQKHYTKAISLFDEISLYYKNTDRSELILNFLAQSYMAKKDYFSANDYYKSYVKSYPKGQYIQEARYGVAYCYYLDSPDVRLDQANTVLAISSLQEFIDLYPETERSKEAAKLLDEMNDKLAQKALINANLYYSLGTYMGRNNYLAAVIEAQNALKKYPATKHREDLMILILKAKYQQAILSYAETKVDRYQAVVDEYYNYINDFPTGKFRKSADGFLKVSVKNIK